MMKRNMRKILSLMCVFALLTGSVICPAAAEEQAEETVLTEEPVPVTEEQPAEAEAVPQETEEEPVLLQTGEEPVETGTGEEPPQTAEEEPVQPATEETAAEEAAEPVIQEIAEPENNPAENDEEPDVPSLLLKDLLSFTEGYALVISKADAYDQAAGGKKILSVQKNDVVYALQRPNAGRATDRLEAAVNDHGTEYRCYIAAECLRALSKDETEALMRKTAEKANRIEVLPEKSLAENHITWTEPPVGEAVPTIPAETPESNEETETEPEREPDDETEPDKTRKGLTEIPARIDPEQIRSKMHKVDLSMLDYGEAGSGRISEGYLPESAHPYQNNTDDYWYLYEENAIAISVTFNSQTRVENRNGNTVYDYISIRDKDGYEISTYAGKELAGKTITIAGEGMIIHLHADDQVKRYGFRVTNARAQTMASFASITTVAGSKAKIQWQAPITTVGYQLQRATADPATGLEKENATYTTISSGTATPDSGISYTDGNTSIGMYYRYRLRFYKTYERNDGRKFKYYTEYSFKNHYIARVPSITGGFGSKYYLGIVIQWDAVRAAKSYLVYRSPTVNGVYERIGETAETSFTDRDIERRSYYYKIKTQATVQGCTYQSAASEAMKLGYVPAPTGVRASGLSATSVRLQWDAVTDATGYVIYRSTSYDTGYAYYTKSTDTSITMSVPTAGTIYYYKMKAFNEKQQYSEFSAIAAVKPMSAPANVQCVTHTKTSVTLKWDEVPGADYYKVFSSYTNKGWVLGAQTTDTQVSIEDLEEDYQYSYFIVKAYADIPVDEDVITSVSAGSPTLQVEKNTENPR